jgi:hypothetical protein
LASQVWFWPLIEVFRSGEKIELVTKLDFITEKFTKTHQPTTIAWDGYSMDTSKVYKREYSTFGHDVFISPLAKHQVMQLKKQARG